MLGEDDASDRAVDAVRPGAVATPRPHSREHVHKAEATTQTDLPTARSDWAFFLDIDGTLLDLAPTPDGVHVPSELRLCLGALERAFGGAVALVSGRSLATIDRLFAPLVLTAAAGQHGAETRAAGVPAQSAPDPALEPIAAALASFAAARPGLVVETKGSSVAVHYRQAPEHADAVRALAQRLVEPHRERLEILPAHAAFDIKPRAATKGRAIAWLMTRAPFAGRLPVFAGDDTTDEDGFAAINARGGVSIRVGRAGERAPSAARHRIGSPAEFRAWLRACVAAVTAQPERRP
ncbi:MAG TPA: trehalose-phosphatase [Candidatus Sulfotelmatobacter sp.]|nr:trehalose-phosphatase [Candidatus Sulfotelmatobacter sp.]